MLTSVVLIKTCLSINIQIITLRLATYTTVGYSFNPAKFYQLIILNYTFAKPDIYSHSNLLKKYRNHTFKCKIESNNNITSTVIHSVLGERLRSHSWHIQLENYEVAKCDWQGFRAGFAKGLNEILS